MNRIYLLLLTFLFQSTFALVVQTQNIDHKLTKKGKFSPQHTHTLQLPYDAKLTASVPFGTFVEEGEDLFHIEAIDSSNGLLTLVNKYFQAETELGIENDYMKAQKELLDIQAISVRSYQESAIKYENKANRS